MLDESEPRGLSWLLLEPVCKEANSNCYRLSLLSITIAWGGDLKEIAVRFKNEARNERGYSKGILF